MAPRRPPRPDALRPPLDDALAAWAARVRADREQVQRCREVEDAADFYAPVAARFAQDPARTDEPVLNELLALARIGDSWLDIGCGGGRYALPLARRVKHLTAVDPSPAMLNVLRSGLAEHAIDNVDIIEGRWPDLPHPRPSADVALMAHVGYDIEAIGPFLEAAEAACHHCVAIMGEGAMTTAAALLWEPVHGEPRVPLPALPELVTLLLAMGRLPRLTLAERTPPAFETLEELLAMSRRQLWVAPGSRKDGRLASLATARASQREQGWALDWQPSMIGIVSWEAAGSDSPGRRHRRQSQVS
jgi:SAM-dependent methyltransferase